MHPRYEYHRAWRSTHPRKEYQREWSANNPDKVASYARKWNGSEAARKAKARWSKRNPEYQKAYNANHKTQFTGYRRKWKKVHPDKVSQDRARRRAMLRSATIGSMKAIQKVYERCAWWRKWFDVSVDHVIPLARGGHHAADNLQIIYTTENYAKRHSLTYKPRVIFI